MDTLQNCSTSEHERGVVARSPRLGGGRPDRDLPRMERDVTVRRSRGRVRRQSGVEWSGAATECPCIALHRMAWRGTLANNAVGRSLAHAGFARRRTGVNRRPSVVSWVGDVRVARARKRVDPEFPACHVHWARRRVHAEQVSKLRRAMRWRRRRGEIGSERVRACVSCVPRVNSPNNFGSISRRSRARATSNSTIESSYRPFQRTTTTQLVIAKRPACECKKSCSDDISLSFVIINATPLFAAGHPPPPPRRLRPPA